MLRARPPTAVFDLDGTLLDSLADIALHLNAALAEAGLPGNEVPQIRAWVGDGARRLVERATARRPDLTEQVAWAYRERYDAAPLVAGTLFPGIDAALDRLHAAGVRLAVLSNKPDDVVRAIGQALLGRWPFAVVRGHRDGAPLKPDPRALLDVLAELDVTPDASVYVGDSEIDVATAQRAGVPCVAVSWGLRDGAALRALGPRAVVDRPADLADAILTRS